MCIPILQLYKRAFTGDKSLSDKNLQWQVGGGEKQCGECGQDDQGGELLHSHDDASAHRTRGRADVNRLV